ncbi:putative Rho-type GTPase-activating protein [Paramyrothecium foliicola]|nr:putative Rho-type GTPase-activating protein [Paramyrothecium foliicola]
MSQLALRRSQAQRSSDAPATAPPATAPLLPTPSDEQDPAPVERSVRLPRPLSLPSASPALRSPRPLIPSPLSATSTLVSEAETPSPRRATFFYEHLRLATANQQPSDQQPSDQTANAVAHENLTFYRDSSNCSTPEPEVERFVLCFTEIIPAYVTHEFLLCLVDAPSNMVIYSVTSRPFQGSDHSPGSAMAGHKGAAKGDLDEGVSRKSSINSAISALSRSEGSSQEVPLDIDNLIQTAGSPEAVIRHLLKEKHSQSQQNSQLWRLVDKQRAMILGLNKDLERSLRDKEKYRTKLKEMMADPAVSKAAGARHARKASHDTGAGSGARGDKSRGHVAVLPDSPILDSGSQPGSPIDVTLAPYPITPPADQPQGPPSAVDELLNPNHSMPNPQEHAFDSYDHEADDKAADMARKERADGQLKKIPYNLSLPPSRALPSEPPKVPPPRLPKLAIVEATPQPDEGLAKFPVPPPRKAPPAPLQLKKIANAISTSSPDEETDSDLDDILDVGKPSDDRRGRRRTREEDDREREILVLKEAEARSASKKSKSSNAASPAESASPKNLSPTSHEGGTASLAAVLNGDTTTELVLPPLRSPGLPASPRSFAFKSPANPSSAYSPRSSSFQAPPLSPRPPRQPIPLPPNTPLAAPIVPRPAETPNHSRKPSQPREHDTVTHQGPVAPKVEVPERVHIYKGFVTEEHPDLLLPPNVLPSIAIKVASSRMKPSRASLLSLTQLEEDPVFTLAILSRVDGGELWRVEKDSASLAKLDQRLKQCSSFTARTPDRSLFSGHAPAKLDARRRMLEGYMDELLNTPLDTATAVELCKYLSTHTLPPNAHEEGSMSALTPEGSVHNLGPDGRPLRSGYLTKRGKNFGGWKARFFVLDGPSLKYYETPGGAHLGTIKLQGAQIGKQSHSNDAQSPAGATAAEEMDNQYRHAFLILEPKKKDSNSHVKHVLCAESDRERDLWVDALLQWIDFRESADPEPHGHHPITHDRRPSATNEHPSGAKITKKGGQSRSHHQPSESDTLIGVKYDSTMAGDAPHVTNARPKTSAGVPDHSSNHAAVESLNVQSSKVISGPKDAHVISDSSSWGNRTGLGIPTSEEKKQRKRSFFGFGPKTRSSSDGQDTVFGGSEGAFGSTPPPNSYNGPMRQVFGAPLAEAVRYNGPTDVRVPLPSVVYRCIQYLDYKNAILEEGIFRLSGSNLVIKALRERFNVEGDINLVTDEEYYDIHAVASLLKLYLRELPTTILTRDLHLDFLATTEITNRPEKLAALNALAQRLPLSNATLLKYLIAFLIKIINNADMNKMTVRNVGIVFSPTLNIPAPVFALFLQNYEAIFGIEPEEYELPSPVSESEDHAPHHFEPPHHRPSTSSGGSASPHRQQRPELKPTQQRTTPTPPLLMSLNGARGSPTPPLGASRQLHEPPHHGQHGGSGPAPRPAYENTYRLSMSHDNHGPHGQSRGQPTHERHAYQQQVEEHNNNLAAYDQPNRRRESAIYMGNMAHLNHQGSKSRLREETRF